MINPNEVIQDSITNVDVLINSLGQSFDLLYGQPNLELSELGEAIDALSFVKEKLKTQKRLNDQAVKERIKKLQEE